MMAATLAVCGEDEAASMLWLRKPKISWRGGGGGRAGPITYFDVSILGRDSPCRPEWHAGRRCAPVERKTRLPVLRLSQEEMEVRARMAMPGQW